MLPPFPSYPPTVSTSPLLGNLFDDPFVVSLRCESLESGQNGTRIQQMHFLLGITNPLPYIKSRVQQLTRVSLKVHAPDSFMR